MRKRYHVIDAYGEEYQVEEENVSTEDEDVVTEEPMTDEMPNETFSEDEIVALRKLALIADQLIGLVDTNGAGEDVVDEDIEEAEEAEEIVDEDVDETEVIDTDEDPELKDECGTKSKDSKRSFGAIERNKKQLDDSLEDDVSTAWTKRFGGVK